MWPARRNKTYPPCSAAGIAVIPEYFFCTRVSSKTGLDFSILEERRNGEEKGKRKTSHCSRQSIGKKLVSVNFHCAHGIYACRGGGGGGGDEWEAVMCLFCFPIPFCA